jgi:cytochrome oxidase Cu insertion factor (SCO1/SenC/PrrC family)
MFLCSGMLVALLAIVPARAAVRIHVTAPPGLLHNVRQLQVGDKVPQTPLVDQHGVTFTLSKYLGSDVLLAFIYTRCRDRRECPLTSAKFRELQDSVRGRPVHLIEATIEPRYDSPHVLDRYGLRYGADASRWTFATGESNNVLDFAAAFGVNPFADPRVGLIHSETLAVIDRSGTIRDLIYTNAWSPNEVVAELDALDRRASNPIALADLWLSRAAVAICGNSVAGFDGFVDLLVVIAIFAALTWVFWRLYRWFRHSAA